MKQAKIIQAYKATEEISKNTNLSLDTLWTFYRLRKALLPHWEFQVEREEALKNKYSQYADENGTISGEPYKEYLNEFNELLNLDKDVEFEKVKLVLQEGMGITIQMMESLDDFVEFTHE